MKKFYQQLLIIFVFSLFLFKPVAATTSTINAYFFYGDGCPHCVQEKKYLSYIAKSKYPELKLYEYEIYNNNENTLLLREIANKLNVKVDGVPFLVINDQTFVGYADRITSKNIEKKIEECLIRNCKDSLAYLVSNDKNLRTSENNFSNKQLDDSVSVTDKKIINLPFIGEVNALNFSLPLLTVLMGVLDGFNPCAMWTLLFLISLLLGMKNRKRMWILGITFIIASASVYFMFMAAWLNLMLFLGFIIWVRNLIGALAILGGSYSLKDFLTNKNSGCKVTGNEKRQRFFERMRLAVSQNSLWLSLGGIIALAFAVNLVELICSAGLPAIYTQVLALNRMSTWGYYSYILLYIFFFMLDDLILFFIAMLTLQMTGVTTKYAKVSRFVGGLIMLVIGLLLIFKPSLLMFG